MVTDIGYCFRCCDLETSHKRLDLDKKNDMVIRNGDTSVSKWS